MIPLTRPQLCVLHPSSRETEPPQLLASNLKQLQHAGFNIVCETPAVDASWQYSAGSIQARSEQLNAALRDPDNKIIWAARGGYGASDLLPLVPWQELVDIPAKLIVGFSDASALLSAFYSRLGWEGLHAPMPASKLWGADKITSDIESTIAFCLGTTNEGQLQIDQNWTGSAAISGPIFGGCLAVLTNLLGTPYFPTSLTEHILFWEDISEPPARVLRFFNQWLQTGSMKGVKAIVLGQFNIEEAGLRRNVSPLLAAELARRVSLPIFTTSDFGHCSPNHPILVGGWATIADNRLSWQSQRGLDKHA